MLLIEPLESIATRILDLGLTNDGILYPQLEETTILLGELAKKLTSVP